MVLNLLWVVLLWCDICKYCTLYFIWKLLYLNLPLLSCTVHAASQERCRMYQSYIGFACRIELASNKICFKHALVFCCFFYCLYFDWNPYFCVLFFLSYSETCIVRIVWDQGLSILSIGILYNKVLWWKRFDLGFLKATW